MRGVLVIAALGMLVGVSHAQTQLPPALPANPVATVAHPPASAVSAVLPNNVRPEPGTTLADETIVCKYERDTGTLMMVQVCRTARAWKIMQADAQEFMEFGFRGSHQVDDH
jgi:hypothetical protein